MAPAGRRRALGIAGVAAAFVAADVFSGCGLLQRAWQRLGGTRILEQRDTAFGVLAVVERGGKRYLSYGPEFGVVYQSVIDLDRPAELQAPYMRLMMLGMVYARPDARTLHIGVGAGNMAGYVIRTFPRATVDAVDIDPHAVELGRRWFGLTPDPRLEVHIEDGRRWLERNPGPFDVVFLDAYDDKSIPPALMDREFFAFVAARLAPGGVAIQNVYLPIVDRVALLDAMGAAFERIDVYRSGSSAVLVAYAGQAREPAALSARARDLDATLRPLHPLSDLLSLRVAGL